MKRIITFIIFLFLCADCLAQDPVQVVRTYITTLSDALSSPNDMIRRRKIENLLGAGSPGIKDEIVEKYNTKSTSRMLAGPYLAIFYDVIQNSSTAWIKVSIIGTPYVIRDNRGVTKVYATLQYSGAISLKTSSEFWINGSNITGIMSDEVGIAEISRNGGNTPAQQQPDPPKPVQQQPDNKPAQQPASGSHQYVDLGLPSGTLWATCNIGANNPWDYGDYFAWGETTTKTTYSWSNYKYANGGSDKLTKYCNKSDYGYNGFTDSRTTLEKSDDVAYQKWGKDWCMPTKKQCYELYNNCTYERTTNYQGKGVAGIIFKSKKNGNTIFFPATGCKGSDGKNSTAGSFGSYLSSSLYVDLPSDASRLYFDSSYAVHASIYGSRNYGFSVRPVRCSN